MKEDILQIRDLQIRKKGHSKPIVDKINLSIKQGEVVALVGESGAGKSITSLSILGFLEHIIVTPSHHRVHHAINEKYIDKNYASMQKT